MTSERPLASARRRRSGCSVTRTAPRELSDQKDADARRLGHPFDIGWALTWGAYVFDYRREPDRLLAARQRGRSPRA